MKLTSFWLDVCQSPLEQLVYSICSSVIEDHDDGQLAAERKVHVDKLEPSVELGD